MAFITAFLLNSAAAAAPAFLNQFGLFIYFCAETSVVKLEGEKAFHFELPMWILLSPSLNSATSSLQWLRMNVCLLLLLYMCVTSLFNVPINKSWQFTCILEQNKTGSTFQRSTWPFFMLFLFRKKLKAICILS